MIPAGASFNVTPIRDEISQSKEFFAARNITAIKSLVTNNDGLSKISRHSCTQRLRGFNFRLHTSYLDKIHVGINVVIFFFWMCTKSSKECYVKRNLIAESLLLSKLRSVRIDAWWKSSFRFSSSEVSFASPGMPPLQISSGKRKQCISQIVSIPAQFIGQLVKIQPNLIINIEVPFDLPTL